MTKEQIQELRGWLLEEMRSTRSYPERVAYREVYDKLEEMLNED